MREACVQDRLAEAMAAIGRAVVGHDALDGDAQGGEPGDGALEEGHGTFLALVGEDLGVGEARGVVDADMQEVPADAALLAAPVAGDAVADAIDPAQLLDVDVNELARLVALVADDLGLGVEGREPSEATPAQDQPDGGDRPAEPAGDGGSGQALAAELHDLGHRGFAEPGRAVVRARRAVEQAGLAFQGVPVLPFAHGLGIDPERRRRRP